MRGRGKAVPRKGIAAPPQVRKQLEEAQHSSGTAVQRQEDVNTKHRAEYALGKGFITPSRIFMVTASALLPERSMEREGAERGAQHSAHSRKTKKRAARLGKAAPERRVHRGSPEH